MLLPLVSAVYHRHHSGLSSMTANSRGSFGSLLSILAFQTLFFGEQTLARFETSTSEVGLLGVLLT